MVQEQLSIEIDNQHKFLQFAVNEGGKQQEALGSGVAVRTLKKGALILFEWLCYFFFVGTFILFLWSLTWHISLPGGEIMPGIEGRLEIGGAKVEAILYIIRFVIFLVSILFLIVGRLLRGLRIKNNALHNCIIFIDNLLEQAKTRENALNELIKGSVPKSLA